MNIYHVPSRPYLSPYLRFNSACQIKSTNQVLISQWLNLLVNRVLVGNQSIIHLDPWDSCDPRVYIELAKKASRLVLWINSSQEIPGRCVGQNIDIVQYDEIEGNADRVPKEHFINLYDGSGVGRTIMSWERYGAHDQPFTGVFVANKRISKIISDDLNQSILDQANV